MNFNEASESEHQSEEDDMLETVAETPSDERSNAADTRQTTTARWNGVPPPT